MDQVRRGNDLTFIDLPIAKGEDIQKRHGLLRLIERGDIPDHRSRLPVLRDHQRLALLGELARNAGCVTRLSRPLVLRP